MGVIDTLSAGFDRVTKRLWLILLPALLDVGIWMGPRLSLRELSRQAIAALADAAEIGGQSPQTIELLRQWLTDVGETTNVLAALSMRLLGLPSLSGSVSKMASPLGTVTRTMDIPTWLALAGWLLLLTLVGLLIGCICLSFIAQEVRDEQVQVAYALQVAWRSWVRLVGLLLVVGVISAIVVGAAAVLSGLLSLFSANLAGLALSLLSWGVASLSVYGGIVFFFTSRAVILDDLNVLRSIWNALNVFHRNLLPAVGFLILVSVLQTGLLYIWRMLAVNVLGTAMAILGNAYVGTGLVMASFIFYRDRLVAWQTAAAQKGRS